MKKLQAIIALLLCTVLVFGLLGACSSEASEQEVSEQTAIDSSDTQDTDASSDEEPAYTEDDATEIEMYVVQFTGTTSEYQRIEDDINAISIPEIGVKVKLEIFESGDYATKLGLMMSSGENADLAYMSFAAAGYSSLYSNGQLMDISSLLQEYAPELMAEMGEYAKTYSIGSGIYALPPYRAYNSTSYIIMRRDILEDIGQLEFAQNMTTWAEVETLFEAVQEAYPLLYPTGGADSYLVIDTIPCGDSFSDTITYDRLGDELYLVYTATDGSEPVSCLYEQEAEIEALARSADWMERGFIWPDSIFSEDLLADNLVKQNAVFAVFQPSEIGVESAKAASCGYDMVCVPIAQIAVTSSNVQKFGICVPAVSDEPEAAVRFLNLWYTDSRICNLLSWGEEGTDYVLQDGEAAYPENVTATTVGFHSHDFLAGNQFLTTPWSGAGADLREQAKADLESAPVSAYLGFTFDSADYSNLIAGLNSVSEEFKQQLTSGGYTEELRLEFLAKLEQAGLRDYLAAYQSQLDSWKAAN